MSSSRVKNHLELRGSNWYIRWDIPKDVRAAFGNKVVIKKRLSSDYKEACRLKTLLLAELQSKAHAYRTRKSTAEAASAAEHEESYDYLSSLHGYVKELNDETRLNIYKDSASLAKECSTQDGINALLGYWFSYIEDVLSDAPQETKIFLSEKSQHLLMVTHEVANKKFETVELREKYTHAVNEFQLEVRIYAQWNGLASELSYEDFRNNAINSERSAVKTHKHNVSTHLLNKWKSDIDNIQDNIKTRNTIKRSVEKFLAHLEETNQEITFQSVADYLEKYSQSMATRGTQLGAIKNLYEWLCKYAPSFHTRSLTIANPVLGHNLKKAGGRQRENYIGYTKAEIKHLFNASFDSCKNGRILATLIAYGAYTGCRIEELAQIDQKSTLWRNGDPIGFQVSDAKTKAGIRVVPIHPHLHKLHKALLSESGGGPIFPHRPRATGEKISYLSTAFGRLKDQLGFSSRHTFHSLRASFITELTALDISQIKIEKIVGHKPVGITMGVYLDDIPPEILHDAILDLDLDLDLSQITPRLPH